ncbi:hypothetical protein [Comamonas sp.]|uniref:hypothetical protein n=1 Tax=Comamonas sp. TaxID=34028 RepID=UPI0012C2742E|nr:hypothetical protein [Comamonas sp.]MPS93160.1 hypothetical protein [Comamonas sp.]
MAYTGWMSVKIDGHENEVMDIPTLSAVPPSDFKDYAETHLLYIDHHDVIRATVGDYPFATSAAQADELIKLLEEFKRRMA